MKSRFRVLVSVALILLAGANQSLAGNSRKSSVAMPGDCIIPHFVSGSEWNTTLILTNVSSVPEEYGVLFTDTKGAAWRVPIAGFGRVDELSGTLKPGQTVTYTTEGTGALEQGWAFVFGGSSVDVVRVVGLAVFRQRVSGRPDFEAVVPISNLILQRFVLLYDNVDGFSTGAALVNPDPEASTTVTAIVRDEAGNTLSTETLSLAPGGQTAFSIPTRFAVTANRRGSILFSSSGMAFSGLGLRFNPSGAFTSFHALATIDMLR